MTTIYYETFPVAHLQTSTDLRLEYDPAWENRPAAFPVSLSMPLKAGPFDASRIMPWLANLLPETHLSEIGQRLKVSPQDVVGMLSHIGRDTAGAFSIGVPRKTGIHLKAIPDDQALNRILDELPSKPFLVGERGVSMSLAGVQEKLPVFVDGKGRMSIPLDGTPSTHILKPDARRLPASVQNEGFCLALARACGLDAAAAVTGRAGDRTYLLVSRYDRFVDDRQEVRRLHQEDLCQLLGYFPYQKYERSQSGVGVSLKQMFDAVSNYVSPAARVPLLDAVIFNVLICNSDAHAKNYSVLIGSGGSAKLAPLYDLMCANVYQNVDHQMPQNIAGRYAAADLHADDWESLAREVGLSGASTLRRVAQLAGSVEEHAEATATSVNAMNGGPHQMMSEIVHEVTKRCRRIRRQLQ